MWIRSQDKTKLLKVERFEYYLEFEQITEEMKDKKGKPIYIAERPAKKIVKEIPCHCIYINKMRGAKYSTEEKALKVLDKIERWINDFSGTGVVNIPVFQIPKDDEV